MPPQAIESSLGRISRERYGPREIDLDLVFYDDVTFSTATLTVPHPSVRERDFVLRPLADVANETAPAAVRSALASFDAEAIAGVQVLAGIPELSPRGERTAIMGILNATPDSFSDGGLGDHVARVDRMVEEGVDVVDLGGESTRPGAHAIDPAEELQRVVPLISAVCERHPNLVVSVDTRRAVVAREAVAAGARIVNDVSAGAFDTAMLDQVAELPATYVATHARGTPATMQLMTDYDDVVVDVAAELGSALTRAEAAGIAPWRLVVDPGIGFAKTTQQNLELVRRLPELKRRLRDLPLLVGPSRKGFIGQIIREPRADRCDTHTPLRSRVCYFVDAPAGAIGALPARVARGSPPSCSGCDDTQLFFLRCIPAADIVRVHNVHAIRDAVAVADAVHRGRALS